MTKMKIPHGLTGQYYFKNHWFFGLQMYVEEIYQDLDKNGNFSPNYRRFRKIHEKDLPNVDLNVNPYIDLKSPVPPTDSTDRV